VSLNLLLSWQRLVLLLLAVALGIVALLLRRRAPSSRLLVPATALGLVAGGTLLLERVLVVAARWSAPADVDFNEVRWMMMAPWGRLAIAAGVVAALGAVFFGWRASARVLSPWRRSSIIALRTFGVAIALIVFLEPALEFRQVAREPNRVAILVDDSRSMSLVDQPGGATTRAEIAEQVVANSGKAFEAWQGRHLVDFFTFSSTLDAATLEQIGTLTADGRATLMREALEQTRARYDGDELAGIVLVTDGTATGRFSEGATDGVSTDFLQSLGTRVHNVWVARPGLRDVSVARLLVDEFAFVRTVVKVEVVIRSTGYGERSIPVSLSSGGKLVRQKWVDLPAGVDEARVEFEFTPPRVGKFVYEVTTPVAPDEAVDSNNTRAFALRVIRDKIRVLQVAGAPSWDVRALRRMLKQNPNVDLISFFILRTHDDLQLASQDEMSLIPFPTRELFGQELPSFDVIVLQNFDYGPYQMGAYLENMRQYVEDGGGLIMLGGDRSFSSGLYAGTPVAKALPVQLLPNSTPIEQVVDTQLFAPSLTEEGKAHPVTALRYEPGDNARLWKKLPELEGINLVARPRESATVLAQHPGRKTADGRPAPVIVAGEYGEGRSLAVTTDSLWRWWFVAAGREGDGGRAFYKLWENAIRWVIRDPELRYLHVEADAPEYYPDDPVELEVRLLDRDYSPRAGGEVTLRVSRLDDGGQLAEIESRSLQTDAGGLGRETFEGLAPGLYRATATAAVGGRKIESVDLFSIRAGSVELEAPAASDAILRAISDATGGRLVAGDRIPPDLELEPPRVVRIDRRSDVELWSQPWLLAVALLLLGAEWALRQRSGSM